jgi:hypothetical protein
VCGRDGCYCSTSGYRRWAIDLFPESRKGRIEIARFECRKEHTTFSLLPVQLIPYHQYTVHAVVCVVLLGMRCWEAGDAGAQQASMAIENDSNVTPWLVLCWLAVVAQGFSRAHAVLGEHFDLTELRTQTRVPRPWAEVGAYMRAILGRQGPGWSDRILTVVTLYSHQTDLFLFGVSSQQRPAGCA